MKNDVIYGKLVIKLVVSIPSREDSMRPHNPYEKRSTLVTQEYITQGDAEIFYAAFARENEKRISIGKTEAVWTLYPVHFERPY